MNLRTRILQNGIRCQPWKQWKGEIGILPISAQTMFRNDGIEIDILEMQLKSEGFLLTGESLYDVLMAGDFKRVAVGIEEFDGNYGSYPDDWTEEDFLYNEQKRGIIKHEDKMCCDKT